MYKNKNYVLKYIEDTTIVQCMIAVTYDKRNCLSLKSREKNDVSIILMHKNLVNEYQSNVRTYE